ncbi:pseudouridine synthase [Defluviimonas sp. D31]|uniref:pseudouridine synthase n=1 Tax=Defluviimonas sp. D31 TaxID=3083253 RepID=UPI00296FC3E3|nr:pseudouridine synthase [Defluviimonas sp. D31]MDW4550314.1 pseudouridine synthase [Defluviimonas sp. D31]
MTDDTAQGERIAKVMARAGVASRRDAEKMILDGRVTVNGKPVKSPALDVLPSDKVTLDGKPIDEPQPARLWLYYKPVGLVTSAKDEKGRQTVFDTMPEGMPRVMSIGRLDLNSEGLLLLTNDGELKRQLELPSTGWLRKYRVRVNGRPNEATFDPLRRGVTIDGEDFLPMDITLDKQQGANAWLTVGLREGKNREIRRAMTEVGLTVNRLIRVSYGPFRLNKMKLGDVVEVKSRVLREQLGGLADGGDGAAEAGRDGGERRGPKRPAAGADRPRKPRSGGDRPERSGDRPYKPRTPRGEGDRPERSSGDRPYKPRAPRGEGDRPERSSGDRPHKPRTPRGEGDRPERSGDRPYKPRAPRGDGDRPERSSGDRPYKPRAPRGDGDRPERSGDRPYKPRAPRGEGDRGPRPGGAARRGPKPGRK